MSKAELYLALCLIDAIEDGNLEAMRLLFGKHKANPNTMLLEKDVAPMHLVVGAEDVAFAEKATELMLQHGGNPNLRTVDQMLTPLHAAASIGRVGIVKLLLKAGGNVEQVDEDDRTPIQHAIEEGHFDVIQLIQNLVFERKIERKRKQLLLEHSTQLHHHQPPEQTMVLSPSRRNLKPYGGFLPAAQYTRLQGTTVAALQVLEEHSLTPNKMHYNFDVTSPYYVNITHRRKHRFKPLEDSVNHILFQPDSAADQENRCPVETTIHEEVVPAVKENETIAHDANVPKRTNLFELTERNLENFTQCDEPTGRRHSFVESWREKIAEMRERSSVSRRLDDIDRILNSFSENLAVRSFMDEVEETFVTAAEEPERNRDGEFDEQLEQGQAEQEYFSDRDVIEKTPESTEERLTIKLACIEPKEIEPKEANDTLTECEAVIIQISEEYIHTDDEAGVIFREKKMTTAPVFAQPSLPKLKVISEGGQVVFEQQPMANVRRNPSLTSQSTAISLPPMDYDTDALRAELTNYGEPPGPITKHTKKLYLRKLIKFRRHPERLAAAANGRNTIHTYSVELMVTVRKEDSFEHILNHQCLEHEMTAEFQSNNTKTGRNFREGHLKKSFIYLLLDPRVTENLPAQQNHLNPHELWKRFLSAVFYVGKGKSSRPYCHLYDAMKLYQQQDDGVPGVDCQIDEPHYTDGQLMIEEERIIFQSTETPATTIVNNKRAGGRHNSRRQLSTDSQKLRRIIDVWGAGKGVVCLHVFHNIMPAEAYTREAAIIDAFGMQNLTNLKRGDYYGQCVSWPMKKRKQLGILLLYKAMLMFLAEGETQLLPSDLM